MALRPHFQRQVERVRALPALPTAIVYPCDRDAIQVALSGQFAGYLAPVLVGPESRIQEAAGQAGLDLSRVSIVDTADQPTAAAQRAVAMARSGEVRALIKGSLYPDDLMRAIAVPDSGLRQERRLTHAFFIDVPGYARSFVVTDALLNIAPNLAAKRDIVQNAIDFAQALGTAEPNVAIVSAVEGVTPALPATGDASALAKMAAQGVISGARVEGPLTVDRALGAPPRGSTLESKVAGNADIVVVPNLEAGAMLVRSMSGVFGALAAGIVLGAKVPVVLGARNDPMEVRMASCVLASLFAQRTREADARAPAARASASVAVAA